MKMADPIDTRGTGYPFNFAAPPPIGTRIVYWRGIVAVLREVIPYTRRSDGQPSSVLRWQLADGRVGFSGLRGKALNNSTPPHRTRKGPQG
jgi:hypothetical protein